MNVGVPSSPRALSAMGEYVGMVGSLGRSRVALVVVLVVVSVGCAVSLVGWRATSSRLDRLERGQRSDVSESADDLERMRSNVDAVGAMALGAQSKAAALVDRVSELERRVGGDAFSSGSIADDVADLGMQLDDLRSCVERLVSGPQISGYC